MNKKGNIVLSLMFFIMALAVVISLIGPISEILNWAQQSDSLNCKGYIYNGDSTHALSFNSTLNGGNSGSPLACLAIKLYLPYILLAFLIGGIAVILSSKGENIFFGPSESPEY
jgi:hypothetical protein